MNKKTVIIKSDNLSYSNFPYLPDKLYPELPSTKINKNNFLYSGVRTLFHNLKLDQDNFNTKNWNPLKKYLKPNQTVLIKPNWVMHKNPANKNSIQSLVTNSAIIKVVIDYCLIALKSKGKIIIADAPLQSCNFNKLLIKTKINILIDNYKKSFPEVVFEIIDLRITRLTNLNKLNQSQRQEPGDPLGYTLVNLGTKSLLMDIAKYSSRFRVTNYNNKMLREHHNSEVNEYLISNSVLNANLIINIPKMKCHIKAGITGALKNMVGINGHKEFLPHHITGDPSTGGDQYIHKSKIKEVYNKIYDNYWSSSIENNLKKYFQLILMDTLNKLSYIIDKDNLFDGGWQGNKTIPRTTVDINNILYYYNLDKKILSSKPVRNVLSIIDGIVAGEGDGPLRPIDKKAQVLIAGFNPLLVDLAMAKLVGFNIIKVKTLVYGLNNKRSKFKIKNLEEVCFSYNKKQISLNKLPNLNFTKPQYWM